MKEKLRDSFKVNKSLFIYFYFINNEVTAEPEDVHLAYDK
jgi:hypothetical protein